MNFCTKCMIGVAYGEKLYKIIFKIIQNHSTYTVESILYNYEQYWMNSN